MINNRQAGRRRGRGGGGNNNNGGQRQGGGNPGRPDNGNRIDNRARGNAAQLLEKYKNLAADAQRQGDRVNTEYYLQFADHYFRVLSESRSRFEEQNQRRQREESFDEFDGDAAEEYGDEGEAIRTGEQQMEARGGNERREPRDRDDYRRDDYRRDGGQRENQRDGQRDTAGQDGSQDGNRRERPARAPRRDGGRVTTADDGQGHVQQTQGQSTQGHAHAIEPANDRADPQGEQQPAEAEPRRRTRTRRERPADDVAPAALDAERLPPSLGIGAAAEPEAEEKPRRRRTRATTAEASQAG